MSDQSLTERAHRARRMVGDMAAEGRGPRMSVPVRPDADEDVFICDTLTALEARVAELEAALRAMFTEYEGVDDMAVPTLHQSAGAQRAESLARAGGGKNGRA